MEIARFGIKQIEHIRRGLVCEERRPVNEIGRRLKNIVAARRAKETQLEHVVGEARRGEIERLDDECRADGNAVVGAGFKGIDGKREAVGQ